MSSRLLASFIRQGPVCSRCTLQSISGFHASATASVSAQKTKRSSGSRGSSKANAQLKPTSRRRLVKDLKPEGKGGRYEVAKPPVRGTKDGKGKASATCQQASIELLLDEEFDRSTPVSEQGLPRSFSSSPLLPALVQSLIDVLGPDAAPMPIQSLALKHLMQLSQSKDWQESLLASETGSGKSIAYLLPLIQYLKETEETAANPKPSHLINPRALVLAPSHELTRQLSVFTKSLIHHAKLRVLCASRENRPTEGDSRTIKARTAREMKHLLDSLEDRSISQLNSAHWTGAARPVDILLSTPVKTLEMARGWGWQKVGKKEFERDGKKFRAGRPEMGLKRVECVVIDEADVLFDPDFRDTTLDLLSEISAARGHPISPDDQPMKYPFHLILTSATIPSSLSTYLGEKHPNLTRLASPHLHRLPSTLDIEHVGWTGGSRFADIEKRLQRVWSEDALRGPNLSTGKVEKSRVVIFCNRTIAVDELGKHLTERGIKAASLTSSFGFRQHGSNRHLARFLKGGAISTHENASVADEDAPLVLITTSLLSRGLDFSPSIRHVFVVDPPRNMVDFLHRAGRTGRAGQQGKVVIFGKLKGRGSESDKLLKHQVRAMASHRSAA